MLSIKKNYGMMIVVMVILKELETGKSRKTNVRRTFHGTPSSELPYHDMYYIDCKNIICK